MGMTKSIRGGNQQKARACFGVVTSTLGFDASADLRFNMPKMSSNVPVSLWSLIP